MNHTQSFERKWDNDPYAIQRTRALKWLGDRWLLARPVTKIKRN